MLALSSDDDDGVSYDPTPYESLGYRVPSPVDEWKTSSGSSSKTGSEATTTSKYSRTESNRYYNSPIYDECQTQSA